MCGRSLSYQLELLRKVLIVMYSPYLSLYLHLSPLTTITADAVYEGIASVLLSRANGLMSRYDQSILQDEEVSTIHVFTIQ